MDFQIYNYTKYKFRVIEGRLSGKPGTMYNIAIRDF